MWYVYILDLDGTGVEWKFNEVFQAKSYVDAIFARGVPDTVVSITISKESCMK